ncbi:MAG TPA: hypothetical protein PLN69_09465 [bacterium]|nr:hypothetical protein [bacterium]
MRKLFYIILFSFVLAGATTFAQQRQGYVKPEIRDAVTINYKMLAPTYLTPMEEYYGAYVDDPRTGRFKIGYQYLEFKNDENGNQVIISKGNFETLVYGVSFEKSEWTIKETIQPQTGRILESQAEGNLSGITIWFFGVYSPLRSKASYKKTATYDWKNMKIYVHFDDPKAPVRTYDLDPMKTLPIFSHYIFTLKSKWTDTSKVYHLPYFDVDKERYEDFYIKFSGEQDKGQIKFESVFHGFGEGGQIMYWVTPPSANAYNGHFRKIISDPKVARYTTFLPVSEEEAKKPVRAWLE